MFARVTTFEGSPEQIEAGVGIFREQAIPWPRDATGFRGCMQTLDVYEVAVVESLALDAG